MEMNEIARDDDAKSEALQENIFSTCTAIRGMTEDATYVTPAAAIEMVRLAVFMLNKVEEVDGISELIDSEFDLKASVFGQILMVNTTLGQMNLDHKAYLMAVAAHMGPDWLDSLRRDVAFMIKVESF